MPNFFVPHTSDPEEAEQAYARMRAENYYGHDTPGRLYRIIFEHGEGVITAQVGREPSEFLDREVLAIIETTNVCTIHTVRSEFSSSHPVAIHPRRIKFRQHFDDYLPEATG